MNRRKLFVANNITIMKSRYQNFSNSIYLAIYLEMDDLYIMCLMICDFFLHSKFYLFVFDATFAASNCNLLAYVAVLLVASFWGS